MPVAPRLQEQWLYSQHSFLTLALLLMLMPRSTLLSSCRPREGQRAPLHFNTPAEPPSLQTSHYKGLFFFLSPVKPCSKSCLMFKKNPKQKQVSVNDPYRPCRKKAACLNEQSLKLPQGTIKTRVLILNSGLDCPAVCGSQADMFISVVFERRLLLD